MLNLRIAKAGRRNRGDARLQIFIVFGFLLALTIGNPARAGEARALVMDVQGSVQPDIVEFAELGAGTVLSVGSGASVKLQHYATCETLTVTGGTVKVGNAGFDLAQARVTSRSRSACSQVINLAYFGAASASTTIARAEAPPTIGLTPVFQFLDNGQPVPEQIDVEHSMEVLKTLKVVDGRAVWPTDQPLTHGLYYVVVLKAGEREATVLFIADEDASNAAFLRP